METRTALIAVVSILLLYFSIRRRIYLRTLREQAPVESKPSVVSQAIMDLAAVAGGIYIAFTALAAFLAVDLPDQIAVWGLKFDPLAALSLVVAIVLPFLQSEPGMRSQRRQRVEYGSPGRKH